MSAEKLSGKENVVYGSVEALEGVVETATVQEPIGKLETALDDQKKNEAKKPDLCACWCSGWAEVNLFLIFLFSKMILT